MVFGVCFYFFLIGFMSVYINSIDRKGKILNDKYTIIQQFCTQSGIDQRLRKKINKSLKYRSKHYCFSIFENNNIIDDVPRSLLCKVSKNMNNGLIKSIPFFLTLDEALLSAIVLQLQPLTLGPREIVYRRGDMSNESKEEK